MRRYFPATRYFHIDNLGSIAVIGGCGCGVVVGGSNGKPLATASGSKR